MAGDLLSPRGLPPEACPAQALKASESLPVCARTGTFLLPVRTRVLLWEASASILQAAKGA